MNRGEGQSNLEIAGSRRNLFKGRVINMIFCGRAMNEEKPSIKLRMRKI